MLYAGPSDVKPRAAAWEGTALQAACGWCGTAVILSDTGHSSGTDPSCHCRHKGAPSSSEGRVCGHLEPAVSCNPFSLPGQP